MKTTMMAVAIAATLSSTAFAEATSVSGKYFGMQGDENSVQRVVTVTPQTRWINVTSGETVKIIDSANGQSVVWLFDTPASAKGMLSGIAPGMAGGRQIAIYVATDVYSLPDV